jgi:hypothetical protein
MLMEQKSTEEQTPTETLAAERPVVAHGPKAGMLTEAQYRERIRRRFFRTLDYASIAISVLFIYGVILVCDYLLMGLIEYLFENEMENASYLAITFKGIKIGLALLAFVLATIHGVRSGFEQYRLDARLAREDEKPHV